MQSVARHSPSRQHLREPDSWFMGVGGLGGLAVEGVPPWPPVSLRVGDQVAELAALGGQATKSPAQQFAVAGVGEGVQGPFGRWPVRLVSCAAMKPALASCSRSRASARSLAWVPLPLPWAPMMMYLRIPPPCFPSGQARQGRL